MTPLGISKADIGGFVGHPSAHPEMPAEAERRARQGAAAGSVVDGQVASWEHLPPVAGAAAGPPRVPAGRGS